MNEKLAIILVFIMILGLMIEIFMIKKENGEVDVIETVAEPNVDRIPREQLDYTTIMNIINTTIANEFEHKCRLEYRIKNVKMFYDFEKELRELSIAVIESFSIDFVDQVTAYHSKEYFAKYVTRTVETLLVEYSKKNKPKTK